MTQVRKIVNYTGIKHTNSYFGVSIGRGRSPLGTMPFFMKLIVSIWYDFFGLGYGVLSLVGYFGSGGMLAPFLIPINVALGGIGLIISLLFWSFPLALTVGIGEAVPVIHSLPFMTMMCLWHGYKTGWRY